jgi:hypothetical protein
VDVQTAVERSDPNRLRGVCGAIETVAISAGLALWDGGRVNPLFDAIR